MKLGTSILGGIGLGVGVALFALGACGGDKSAAPVGTGGSASQGGSGSSTGGVPNTSAGGNTNTTATGGSTTTGTGTCPNGPTVVSADNPKITDFSEVAATTQYGVDVSSGALTNFTWGTTGLTGGTSFYFPDSKPADGLQASIVGGALELKAALAANDYDGYVMWFGPNCGSDASAYSGISFTILGSLGGTTVDLQMQMTQDYPLNDNNKGTCDYLTADAGKWSYCKNPHVALSTLLPGGVTTAAQTLQIPWTALVGGNPVSAIDKTQLLGFQIQFNCGSTACAPDITIDDMKFYN